MLLRLLKSLFTRASRRPAGTAESSAVVVPGPSSSSRAAAASSLEVLSRLTSFAGGHDVRLAGTETPADDSPVQISRAEHPVMEVVARAARLTCQTLGSTTEKRVQGYAEAFTAAAPPSGSLNVFTFHVDMPGKEQISYVDVKFNPGKFDYLDILRRFIARIRDHCEATVYVVTSPGTRYRELAAPDVRVIELPLNASQPMYERANALLAYARSAAFAHDTVFLDSDAMVNRPLHEVFDLGFDIGLTYRDMPYLMPVNEGVIFLGVRRAEAVRRFLERRLATYDAMVEDTFVTGFYGDVKRWRGGQLSLNAVSYDHMPHSPYRVYESDGCRIRMLPCDTFNFASGEGEAASALEHLDDRYVVHFKGNRKHAFRFAAKAERSGQVTR